MKCLLGILAGGAVACFIGFVDDIFDIDPKSKFLGQIIAALILVSVGILGANHRDGVIPVVRHIDVFAVWCHCDAQGIIAYSYRFND